MSHKSHANSAKFTAAQAERGSFCASLTNCTNKKWLNGGPHVDYTAEPIVKMVHKETTHAVLSGKHMWAMGHVFDGKIYNLISTR